MQDCVFIVQHRVQLKAINQMDTVFSQKSVDILLQFFPL